MSNLVSTMQRFAAPGARAFAAAAAVGAVVGLVAAQIARLVAVAPNAGLLHGVRRRIAESIAPPTPQPPPSKWARRGQSIQNLASGVGGSRRASTDARRLRHALADLLDPRARL